jgi:hypothetical protein
MCKDFFPVGSIASVMNTQEQYVQLSAHSSDRERSKEMNSMGSLSWAADVFKRRRC